MNASTKQRLIDIAARTLVLSFGGVALLQWMRSAMGGEDAHSAISPYIQWLRDGSIALPVVAFAVYLATRRAGANAATQINAGLVALFSVAMGAGSVLRAIFPETVQGAHSAMNMGTEQGIVTLSVLQTVTMVMLVSAAYAMLVDMTFKALDGEFVQTLRRLVPQRMARVFGVALALMVIMPAFAFTGEKAAAATSFPDQVIHPKGTLNLIAQTLGDGSMAYVAPDYGALGTRPTIEMTEGETLNINLKNQLSVDVSLHVHGVNYSQDSDGTRMSNSFVKPGQTRTYQWRAATGTAGYWHYHDHVVGDDEGTGGILGGLYGGLIVRKPGDPKPAKTFVIVSMDKTLNGRIYPDTPTYTARQGELVEWLIISHGNRVHTFHLHGHRWLTPTRGSDPNPNLPANANSGHEDNHILAPGDSFGFLIVAGDGVGPGMWMYHCHFQDHASAMMGFFQVLPPGPQAQSTETSHTFPETGKTVAGRFLEYWKANGGLAQQGLPLSDEITEKSDLDGKTYKVQYFERALFEYHPENKPPYDVLLAQLGTFRYKQKYGGK